MNKDYSITYDFGTGSVKAALIDKSHTVVSWCSLPYDTCYPVLGFATQKVSDYWDCFCIATKKLMDDADISGEQIKGVVISQTSSSMIFVDDDNHALNDCVIWSDNRAVKQAEDLNRESGYEWTQGKRIPAKLRWFMEKDPETIANAKYLLDVSAYFYLRLTGETALDYTAANVFDLLIPGKMEWDLNAIAAVGIKPSLLPERVIYGFEKVGDMLPGHCEEAGFIPGIPVFGGCSDNANAQLGTGCIHPGDANIYMGSSGWISVTVDRAKNLGVPTVVPSAVPGLGYHYYCTNAVGTSVDYVISQFYKEEEIDPTINVYDVIAEEALAIEDDLQDVLFLPFLLGEEEPVLDPDVRGSLINISANTTRAHIIRACMEGIAFNFRWIKEKLMAQHAWNINFLRAIGGGTTDDTHMQIMADVMGETITRLTSPRVRGNLGLAACIDIGLGEAEDFSVLEQYMKVEKVFVPRPEFKERYDRLFEIYKDTYLRLKGTYASLNREI